MTLYDKIIKLYPELKDVDLMKNGISLLNTHDGLGDYIAKWEHPTLERPTEEQLDAVEE